MRLARRARARLSAARRGRGGFALIESLVAFVILTMAVGALLQGLGGGARNEARGDFLLRAARQGRSQLEALGLTAPITPGESGGRYPDGLMWRLFVQPIRDIPSTDGTGRTTAYLARVTVRRPADSPTQDQLTLTTVKLVLPKLHR